MIFSVRAAVAPAIRPLAKASRLYIDAGLKTGDFACLSCSLAFDFLTALSAAGTAGVLGAQGLLADQGPPEVTTIRLPHDAKSTNLAS
jgi:hypothetical protein